MASEKIVITNRLRTDIIERRKSMAISSYDLSERVGNGHSKFWLQNIECGKTKKITKEDLISLYMALNNEDDNYNAAKEIEQIINQPISDEQKQWYDLINISPEFSDVYDEETLDDLTNEFIEDKIEEELRNSIFGLSVNKKQAALTALQNFHYSLYKNPELALALINIPIYAVKNDDISEYSSALNDLLSLAAKYNDLVIENKSMETINAWNEYDAYYAKIDKQNIHIAFNNFKAALIDIIDASKTKNPDMHEIVNNFNVNVTFMIERGQPNATKHHLKSFRAYTGKEFATHIKECERWFIGFEHEYELPFIYDEIDKQLLDSVYEYLNGFGEIHRIIK